MAIKITRIARLTVPLLLLLSANAWSFEPRMTVSVSKSSSPQIQGETNLPDGALLMLIVTRPDIRYSAQDQLVVKEGRFQTSGLSVSGRPLPPGKYGVQIFLQMAASNPPNVRAVIGSRGELMTGPLVAPGKLDKMELTFRSSIEIPSQVPSANQPNNKDTDRVKNDGRAWMASAPEFCRSASYADLSLSEQSVCNEAAFRYLSKRWETVTASNGQAFEIALDTATGPLPTNVDPRATLRAASVTVYVSEGKTFNPENVLRYYFDCIDRFQTSARSGMSQPAFAPPLSVAGRISSIACAARKK